jgi:N-methylhydantoinase B
MVIDPIRLEVFRHLFAAAAEEMGLTLGRAALSPNIKERLDFSCAIFDGAARMVAQAAHIPVHLGSMPDSVRAALAAFEGDLRPGDVVILNDPYRGGSHLPDITLVSPVFTDPQTPPAFFVASRAHHADVGGMSPGSLPLSTEIYQEGLLIPPIKLMAGGVLQQGVLGLICANSRTPDERAGDLQAQLAAHQVGEKRLQTMIAEYGLERVQNYAQALQAYARRLTCALIASIPDGVYQFEDALEGDGQSETPIPIRLVLHVQGEALELDFSGTAAQVAGNLNAVESVVKSAVYYCLRLLAEEDLPVNQGCFDPIRVICPPHSLLNPDFPAGVAIGNTETSQRVVDVVLGALALALPDRIPAASQGTMNNFTCGGVLPDGRAFVYYETIGGGHGAGPGGPGLSGRHSHMTNTLNTPVEALERALPLRILEYGLCAVKNGPSRYAGGAGLRRVYEFLAPARATLNTERRQTPPYGLAGGEAGQRGRNILVRGGVEIALGAKHSFEALPGDVLVIETPGGGGWGHN